MADVTNGKGANMAKEEGDIERKGVNSHRKAVNRERMFANVERMFVDTERRSREHRATV